MMKKIFALAFFVGLGGCMVDTDRDDTELVGEAAQAVVSNTVSATFTLSGSTVSINTSDMPKGWFTPQFSKSPITVSWSADATACNASASGSYGSGSGTFNPVVNNGGQVNGYSWSASQSLAGLENHWHNYVACDGSVSVVGCDGARTVNYSLTVGGSCGSDPSKCTATGSVSLAAVQDADVVETNCAVGCDLSLGACVSACQANCANGDSSCSSCCECNCKEEQHAANSACPAPQGACYVNKPNRPACL